jgi:ribonucleoside-diphosphate reductase alpha chain
MLLAKSAALPDAADHGVMERFSCKMAIAPTASISIICGGTSPCIEPIPANVYTHKTLSGSFSSATASEALLVDKAKNTDAIWNSILERGGSVQPRLPDAGGKGCFKTASNRPALGVELAADYALYRSGAVAQPVHPGRRRKAGPADAPLPRVGTRHQIALLPPLEVGAARRLRGQGQADNTAEVPKYELSAESTDYDECLACQCVFSAPVTPDLIRGPRGKAWPIDDSGFRRNDEQI